MKKTQYTDADSRTAGGGHLLSPRAASWRFVPVLAGLFLLAGCASLPDWLPDLTGGEGKIAQRVSSQVIDGEMAPTPAKAGPSREKVAAIQTDLAELGYYTDEIDGSMGPLTRKAIKAYQKDAGLKVDGAITQALAGSLAAARGSENVMAAEGTDARKLPPESGEATERLDSAVFVKNAEIQPLYDAGDAYIWNNGRVETVARVAGDKLFWRVDNGVRFTADRNFLIPPSSWAGPSGAGEADASLDERKSWPLRANSPLVFDVTENGNVEGWRCEIAGTEQVSVPAGRFDAVALACDRDSAPPGEWVRRVWFYAPAVRHYVARHDIMADGGRVTKELVGIRPGAEGWPPAVRAGLGRAIQDALGALAAGKSSQWSSTVIKEEFEIIPGPIRETGEGGRCRIFELIARSAGNSRSFPAKACALGGDNKWLIPGDSGGIVDGLSMLIGPG